MAELYGKGAEILAAAMARWGVTKVFGVPYAPISDFYECLAREGLFAPALSTREMAALTLGMTLSGRRTCMAAAGTSIFQCLEAISYSQAYEVPLTVIAVGKASPGYGNPYPYQGDLGSLLAGDFPPFVVSPGSVVELPSALRTVIETAEGKGMPAVLYLDSALFHMTGTAEIEGMDEEAPWGFRREEPRSFSTLFLDSGDMDRIHKALAEKRRSLKHLASCESYRMDDADCALCGYGVAGFIARKAVDLLRTYGVRAGLLRPMTLEPLPDLNERIRGLEKLVVVEMSHGQLGALVERAVPGVPLKRFETYGGKVPDVEELVAFVRREA